MWLLVTYWVHETSSRGSQTSSDVFSVLEWVVSLLALLALSIIVDRYVRLRRIDVAQQKMLKVLLPLLDPETGTLPRIVTEIEKHGICTIFGPGERPTDFLQLLEQAKSVRILSIAAEFYGVGSPEFMSILSGKLKSGHRMQFLLADPISDSMKMRYADENCVDPIGPLGLQAKLRALCDFRASLPAKSRRLIEICVYRTYPTMSLAILDEHVFVYFYGMGMLGTQSPVLHFVGSEKATVSYFIAHFENVKKNAISWDSSHGDT